MATKSQTTPLSEDWVDIEGFVIYAKSPDRLQALGLIDGSILDTMNSLAFYMTPEGNKLLSEDDVAVVEDLFGELVLSDLFEEIYKYLLTYFHEHICSELWSLYAQVPQSVNFPILLEKIPGELLEGLRGDYFKKFPAPSLCTISQYVSRRTDYWKDYPKALMTHLLRNTDSEEAWREYLKAMRPHLFEAKIFQLVPESILETYDWSEWFYEVFLERKLVMTMRSVLAAIQARDDEWGDLPPEIVQGLLFDF